MGTAAMWNTEREYGWGQRAKKLFPDDLQPPAPDDAWHNFGGVLHCRRTGNGQALTDLLHPGEDREDGWVRFALRAFTPASMSKTSTTGTGQADWQQAWHGCTVEALYAIRCDGCLRESEERIEGHRCLQHTRGVYLHGAQRAWKADNYSRFVPLFSDNTFWRIKFEVYADRTARLTTARCERTNGSSPRSRSCSQLCGCA
jgi:hypothetical protein